MNPRQCNSPLDAILAAAARNPSTPPRVRRWLRKLLAGDRQSGKEAEKKKEKK